MSLELGPACASDQAGIALTILPTIRAGAEGRGIGRAMGMEALDRARMRGYTAMQFNGVVSSNTRAVQLWQNIGFNVVGRVDALVMFRTR